MAVIGDTFTEYQINPDITPTTVDRSSAADSYNGLGSLFDNLGFKFSDWGDVSRAYVSALARAGVLLDKVDDQTTQNNNQVRREGSEA